MKTTIETNIKGTPVRAVLTLDRAELAGLRRLVTAGIARSAKIGAPLPDEVLANMPDIAPAAVFAAIDAAAREVGVVR